MLSVAQRVNIIYKVNMSHDSPGQRRRAQRRARILDATLTLVRQRGIAALTMSEIAEASDYTPGALYRYFPSKGSLISALLQRELSELSEHLSTRAPAVCDDPVVEALAQLLALGDTLRRLARERPATLALLQGSLADPARHVADEDAIHTPALIRLLTRIADRIAAASAVGALSTGDPSERALSWAFGLLGNLQLAKLQPLDARLAPDRLAGRLTHDLLLGWGACPRALGSARTHLEEIP